MTLQVSWTCAAALQCVHDCSHRAARSTLQRSVDRQLQQQISVLPSRREKPTGQPGTLRAEARYRM